MMEAQNSTPPRSAVAPPASASPADDAPSTPTRSASRHDKVAVSPTSLLRSSSPDGRNSACANGDDGRDSGAAPARIAALEAENEELRTQLESARAEVAALRQQAAAGRRPPPGAGGEQEALREQRAQTERWRAAAEREAHERRQLAVRLEAAQAQLAEHHAHALAEHDNSLQLKLDALGHLEAQTQTLLAMADAHAADEAAEAERRAEAEAEEARRQQALRERAYELSVEHAMRVQNGRSAAANAPCRDGTSNAG